jgi:hypothetical protein
MYFVVKPVDSDGELRAFLSPKAANEWAQTGAYQEYGTDICEIYTVDCESKEEAIEKVATGQAGEPSARVYRRLTAREIEAEELAEANRFLQGLGL